MKPQGGILSDIARGIPASNAGEFTEEAACHGLQPRIADLENLVAGSQVAACQLIKAGRDLFVDRRSVAHQ